MTDDDPMTDEHVTPQLNDARGKLAGKRGREYWRSLEELADTEEFQQLLQREFPRQAPADWDDGVSRRRFLELAGASLGLAGLTACTRQPREAIVPYVKQPEELVPGRPLFYATAFTLSGYATGLLVESHTGRPTKIEGNPDHPASLGATDVFAQAATLTLYDPDRSQTPLRLGEIRTWAAFAEELQRALLAQKGLGGAGFRILTETVTSPTLAAQLRAVLAAYPQAKWHQWEPAGRDRARAGARAAFGAPLEVRYDFSKADVVLTLDADPFCWGPGSVRYAKDFGRRRNAAGPRMRLYAIESTPTSTGTLADHRLPLASGDLAAAAASVLAALGGTGAGTGPWAAWAAAAATDLKAAGARAVVVPGEFADAHVHVLAHAINQALGAIGSTMLLSDPVEAEPVDQLASLKELAAEMTAGKVDLLLILGGNPVFDAPADLDFGSALRKVGTRAHLSLYDDETSALCQWHLPETHFLEGWSDARAFDGTVSIVQPLIEPLYQTRTAHEVLAELLGQQQKGSLDVVKAAWQQRSPGVADFEAFWRKCLHDGLVADTALAPRGAAVKLEALTTAVPTPARGADTFEINFRPDPAIHDGRFANNGWLMELPRPLSKVTWDNAAYMSLATAQSLALFEKKDDRPWNRAWGESRVPIVEITVGAAKVELPAVVLPGHPDHSITVHLGYGRTRAGRVGNDVGADVYKLRTSQDVWRAAGSVRGTGRLTALASTQLHFNMEGRHLVRHVTAAELAKDPEAVQRLGEAPKADDTLYPPHRYDGHAWGMAVNLSSCTGCNACVVACQSENNIPVVGKEQVRRGREMHWLRIDRYYEGPPEAPAVHNQPVLCMHCEKAPCEVVCPVNATSHSDEGLNEMTYNRCVGTKYCSNNCPYKVRRFNFFEFNGEGSVLNKNLPVLRLLANPDVTVRTRGVMEKCTFCVQRINHARMDAEKENRRVRDGELTTACAQVCPTEALVFGDINDPTSRVTKLKKDPLNYGLLEELNTRPRVTYLAKVSNPNTAVPVAAPGGAAGIASAKSPATIKERV